MSKQGKGWVRCVHGETGEEWYTNNLSGFADDHGLDKSTCYKVLHGKPGFRSHHKWEFHAATAVPYGARTWGDDPSDGEVPFDEAVNAPIGQMPEREPEQAKADSAVDNILQGRVNKPISEMTPLEKYRELSDLIIDMSLETAQGKREDAVGWRPKDLTAVLAEYAKAWNIDPKKAQDMRTEGDKVVDAAEEILRNGAALFEVIDPVRKKLREGMVQIRDNAERVYREKFSGSGARADSLLAIGEMLGIDPDADEGGPPNPKVIKAAAQKWIDCLDEIQSLVDQARNPVVTDDPTMREEIIEKGTHLLRFQLYAGRSDIGGGDDEGSIYQFAGIHAEMSMRIWLMRARAMIDPELGIVMPGDTIRTDGVDEVFKGIRYVGALMMLPPRHGKTDTVIHDIVLSICQRPTIQMAIVHDKETEASKVLRAAQRMLSNETSRGRRVACLFPGMRLADYDNNQKNLRVHSDNPPRNPNLIAVSVWSSGQGNNLDRVYGDDLVPQSDMTEANTRENRKTRFAGTWLSRLQGSEWDVILTGYPRHHEDLMWTYYKESRASSGREDVRGMNFMCMRTPVGGPRSTPPYFAIWPEMYPATELRSKYRQFNDASLWAANYMLQPITSDQRIVEKLRLFDPQDPDIKRALESPTTQFHLSVDPAAKGDGTGDKAGVIVAALVDMMRIDVEADREIIYDEKLLLIIHEDEFYATQTQISEHMVAMTTKYPIEMAHVEEVTGLGSAIKEGLETHYNITNVIAHGTGNKGKAARLKAVAPVLEHSDPALPAKVAFPGERVTGDDGEAIEDQPLQLRAEFRRLSDYVVNYAATSGHHSLDAMTQLIRYLVKSGDLAVYQGEFARQVTRSKLDLMRTRKLKRLQAAAQAYAGQENPEYAFFGDSNTPI